MGVKKVVLTFDDACRSHYSVAAPCLKKHGFNATFFVCRFHDEWFEKNGHFLMTIDQIAELSKMGFEIGNHTWSHIDMRYADAGEQRAEIARLEKWLTDAGIPKPVNFAYPGGPFAPNAIPVLQKFGFAGARTTEHRTWNRKTGDPMNIPSFSVQSDDESLFDQAMSYIIEGDEDSAAMILFHGTPDEGHDFVSTPPGLFEKYMQKLADENCTVLSMKDFQSGK